jgi:hypothetical protein
VMSTAIRFVIDARFKSWGKLLQDYQLVAQVIRHCSPEPSFTSEWFDNASVGTGHHGPSLTILTWRALFVGCSQESPDLDLPIQEFVCCVSYLYGISCWEKRIPYLHWHFTATSFSSSAVASFELIPTKAVPNVYSED